MSFPQNAPHLPTKHYPYQQQPQTWAFPSNYNVYDNWNVVTNQNLWPDPQSPSIWNTSWTQLSEQAPSPLSVNKQHLSTPSNNTISKEKHLKFSGKQLHPAPPPNAPCNFIPVTSQHSWDQIPQQEKIKQPKPHPNVNTTPLPTSTPTFNQNDFVSVKHHHNPWNPKLHNNAASSKNRHDHRQTSSKSNKRSNDIEEELNQQSLYKTELCHSWTETGQCRYGTKCQFAHGKDELRPVLRHPKYKTEICKTFHTLGTCPYGTRCRFIHNLSEKKGRWFSTFPSRSRSFHCQWILKFSLNGIMFKITYHRRRHLLSQIRWQINWTNYISVLRFFLKYTFPLSFPNIPI